MPQVRSIVRPNVRSLIRGNTAGIYGATSYHDGISYNAETGRVVVKAVGGAPTIGTLTSLFTFTGGNQSMFRASNGLLVQSATNTPRIEYDAGGSCLGLLMEAARTNLCLQSEAFGTSWTVSGSSVTSNSTTGPDGASTADTLVESSGGTFHVIRQDIAISANTAYTFSIFVKAAGRTACKLQVSNTLENTGANCDFNLSTGTAGSPTNFGTGASSAATIEPYANGWYRISLRVTIDASSTTGRVQLLLANPVGTTSYSGDGASGLYLYGAQYEAGQFASSYIPTATTSVARTADVCTRTLGSELSATAGTVVVRGRASGGQDAAGGQGVIGISDNTLNNDYRLIRPLATDIARVSINTAAVNQGFFDATFVNSTSFKSAFAWQVNDAASSFNGGAPGVDTSVTLPAVTILHLGGGVPGTFQMNGHIRTFDYYPTRQTNAFLVTAST